MQPDVMKLFWLWAILKKSKINNFIWAGIRVSWKIWSQNLAAYFFGRYDFNIVFLWSVQVFVISFSWSWVLDVMEKLPVTTTKLKWKDFVSLDAKDITRCFSFFWIIGLFFSFWMIIHNMQKITRRKDWGSSPREDCPSHACQTNTQSCERTLPTREHGLGRASWNIDSTSDWSSPEAHLRFL